MAKEGGFPPSLKLRRTGRIADFTVAAAAGKGGGGDGSGIWASHVWMSCWKISWVFKLSVTTMMGRFGSKDDRRTARNGWAAGLTASKDNDSPFSTDSRRLRAAGVHATAENKSAVAGTDGFMPTGKAGPGWWRIQGRVLGPNPRPSNFLNREIREICEESRPFPKNRGCAAAQPYRKQRLRGSAALPKKRGCAAKLAAVTRPPLRWQRSPAENSNTPPPHRHRGSGLMART